jgi:hypothetical protein
MLYKSNDWPSAIQQLSLTINGGKTADGQTVQALPPSNNDTWVSTYYYTYAIVLAQSNLCSQALPLTQTIMDVFRANDIAVYNAQYAQNLCAKNLGTASPQSGTTTPQGGATPQGSATPGTAPTP